ncbi:exodeoxyribonuclease V beta subunit [Motilibacter rhizosphaerae]|uniref:RecBCD enzyme subunit RecB n=1 Tax=Motilibacter rhizosphaerae TaxID=598652 RepID=A0A4Q7NNP8_9ACTN|nr:UvrD-helicase domain-containing protein [Motilibacter rhizosphaerae]RZS86861.1 exodeoxyribonuclease V beta subunit [Motilibacter rhizosphaerae]
MSAARFDLAGPLPAGTTVLEASAGTGKTFTIAALVLRYLLEAGTPMEELLVVSFSRDASRELRERVRERLVTARDGFASGRAHERDEVLQRLLDTDEEERRERLRRLDVALASFDAATVTTTHGFCQQVLATLGTGADHDPAAVLLENPRDLLAEVADDLYLRKWGLPGAPPPDMSRKEFLDLASAVAQDPATRLVPGPDAPEPAGQRSRIATAVRGEFEARKRRLRLLDYDDMLQRLARTLTDTTSAPAAKARLRRRYSVVLVDEFQDTDPVQWSILREAFHRYRTLVLIGDPKQAIYRFRGADVHAYLNALSSAEAVSTLPTNWRSDALLLRGLDAVFSGAALGDPRIRVVPVESTHAGRLVPAAAPVRLRVVTRTDRDVLKSGLLSTAVALPAVVADVAAEVTGLLARARLHPRDGSADRSVEPGDIAVLCRTAKQALAVEEALRGAGVPVVLSSRSSVFASRAAQEWLVLLEALEQPHRATRVRRLAVSAFVGLTAEDLDAPDALRRVDDLALALRTWALLLEERGVAALFEQVSLAESLQPRVLGQLGGERLLTDLRHVTEALHRAAIEGSLGLTALLTWLRRRRAEAEGDEGQERSRRLESDAAAVQVMTVHTSKGLEFPVVLVPFAYSHWSRTNPSSVVFHEGDERVRDVGGPTAPDWQRHLRDHDAEETDDELRLTYVALTRAQGHLVMWWAPTTNTPAAPLHRLLAGSGPDGVLPQRLDVLSDAASVEQFRERAAASDGGFAVEVVGSRELQAWKPTPPPPPQLELARFDRPLDLLWRRTSYSSLTAAAHEGMRFGSEPETAQKEDEADLPVEAAHNGEAHLHDVPSPWSELPGGTAFGTLVHAALEDLSGDLRGVVTRAVGRYAPGLAPDGLVAALESSLATPLDLAGGVPLAAFEGKDRLAELEFELPLAGGDDPGALEVLLERLAPLWRRHVPGGLLSAYAAALAHLAPPPVRGYLTGSIDAVLRTGDGRFVVVDYKTNRLAPYDEPLTAWHYRPAAMERAMIESHYPLQALLYSVALHRYLRWRLPAYDPAQHLGGALYLFLRGMVGPGVSASDGSAPGVFSWQPPPGLVVDTSDLLAGTP